MSWETIAEWLRLQGFSDGMNPRRKSLGHISKLPLILLSVFDSGEPQVDDALSVVDKSQRQAVK